MEASPSAPPAPPSPRSPRERGLVRHPVLGWASVHARTRGLGRGARVVRSTGVGEVLPARCASRCAARARRLGKRARTAACARRRSLTRLVKRGRRSVRPRARWSGHGLAAGLGRRVMEVRREAELRDELPDPGAEPDERDGWKIRDRFQTSQAGAIDERDVAEVDDDVPLALPDHRVDRRDEQWSRCRIQIAADGNHGDAAVVPDGRRDRASSGHDPLALALGGARPRPVPIQRGALAPNIHDDEPCHRVLPPAAA